jgi:hypothetical protein
MRPGKRFGLSAIQKSDMWRQATYFDSLFVVASRWDSPGSPSSLLYRTDSCRAGGYISRNRLRFVDP